MKSLFVFAFIAFALSFCGIVNRLTSNSGLVGEANSNSAAANSSTIKGAGDKNIEFEKPALTDAQKVFQSNGKEIKWDEQGIAWQLPAGYRKLSQDRNSFNYMGADSAAMLINISPMASDFPVDASVKANYDGAITRMKNGEVEKVRYLEIDGVRGVEFIEAKKDSKDDSRRHQWLAFRKYAGQTQMLNFMLAAKDSAFEKHRDEFAAILYSSKIV
ncbi:MAG: hypothetical protein ABI954_13010, partial [Pyrinomonadaceae bacterium]